MTIEQLKDDYERKIQGLDEKLFNEAPDMNVETRQRLVAKRNCYKTFLDELSKIESDNVANTDLKLLQECEKELDWAIFAYREMDAQNYLSRAIDLRERVKAIIHNEVYNQPENVAEKILNQCLNSMETDEFDETGGQVLSEYDLRRIFAENGVE